MFNHYTQELVSQELILFNSYLGKNYLIIIQKGKKAKF